MTQQDDTDYQWPVIPDMTAMECPDVVSPITNILAASVHYSVYKRLFYNSNFPPPSLEKTQTYQIE